MNLKYTQEWLVHRKTLMSIFPVSRRHLHHDFLTRTHLPLDFIQLSLNFSYSQVRGGPQATQSHSISLPQSPKSRSPGPWLIISKQEKSVGRYIERWVNNADLLLLSRGGKCIK